MKYLIFSKLNRNHFLFLSYFTISILKDFVNRYMYRGDDLIFSFNRYYIITLSDFLSIIPLIIIKVRSKNISIETQEISKDKKRESFNSIKYIYTDNSKKRKKRIIKLSILISLFYFLAIYINVTYDIITTIFNITIKKVDTNSNIFISIISKFVLSSFILRLPIYKHHYLSLAINLIFFIGLIIYEITIIKEAKTYLYMLKKVCIVIFYSFDNVYTKVLLSFDSISPYTYLLYRGIFRNIFSLLYSFVFIFVNIPDENGIKSCIFLRYWKVFENKKNILFYIFSFFVMHLYNLNIYLIIDKFSPIHYAVWNIIENFDSTIILMIYRELELKEFFIKFSLYLVLIFASLIYNEFIVLNFCGFQKNTNLFLQKKEIEDLELTILNNNENELFPEDEKDKNEIINIKENLNNESRESNLTKIKK